MFGKNLWLFSSLTLIILITFSLGCPGKEGKKKMKTKVNPKEIKLPSPKTKGKLSLEEVILKRRSKRSFLDKRLSGEQISQLLWSAQGITNPGLGFRSAPSAGATYPLELYLVSADGVFHYIHEGHKLIELSSLDLRPSLAKACLGQSWVREASVNIVIAAIYSRTTDGYGQRGIMYVHMEAGHVAQNILLQAVALELGGVPIGAFIEEEVEKLLSLPEEEKAIYIIPVGYPRE